ncbi:GGDEF domain-containing protein [Pseudoalteromonas sp. A601]|uniref:GGDEF domain-containing protein n=1 Tax=Pseudoalteromonas sp. A601 TaxID=1967839 RepID=UPI00111FACDC|nr:GGDEF domain-containing protein [Pseudoalteromonas sp. A601]
MLNYSDQGERKFIIKYFACIGCSATSLMAIVAILDQKYILFLSLTISSCLFLYSCFICRKEKIAASIISYTLYILMLFLVFTGGVKGTGPIWILIVSPVTFFIRGLILGAFDSLLFLISVITAFIATDYFGVYEYHSPELIVRIILCFFIVALLSGFYEYFRERYSQKLIVLAKENQFLANQDPLTGLPNRRFTVDYLSNNELNISKELPLSIVLFDIDNFKKINDSYGHGVGDQALVHFANVFTQTCRSNDIIARWGGEEFLLVLEGTDKNLAIEIAEKLRLKLLNTSMNINNQSIKLTVSGGVEVIYSKDTLDLAIKSADDNLYRAKIRGKNRICY